MTAFKVLAFLAMACVASFAHGSELSGEDLPEAVGQQRSLLAISTTPAYYYSPPAKPQVITGRVALLISVPRRLRASGIVISYKVGANTLIKRIRSVQRAYNKAYKAKNSFSVRYVAGPKTIKRSAWVVFRVTAQVGPAGAKYQRALKRALRRAVKKKSTYVIKVKGGI